MPEKITWFNFMRKFDANLTEAEANYILWNETCFPFDTATTIKQIEDYFMHKKTRD